MGFSDFSFEVGTILWAGYQERWTGYSWRVKNRYTDLQSRQCRLSHSRGPKAGMQGNIVGFVEETVFEGLKLGWRDDSHLIWSSKGRNCWADFEFLLHPRTWKSIHWPVLATVPGTILTSRFFSITNESLQENKGGKKCLDEWLSLWNWSNHLILTWSTSNALCNMLSGPHTLV